MLPNHIGQHRSQRGGVGNEANRRLTRQSQRSIAKTPSEMDIPKHGPVRCGPHMVGLCSAHGWPALLASSYVSSASEDVSISTVST